MPENQTETLSATSSLGATSDAPSETQRRPIPSSRVLAFIVGLGVLIFWPALRAPFFLDDYLHRAMVAGTFPGGRGRFDLYDFVGDDNRAALFEHGHLPWWSHPQLKIRFFRPLASALVWLDHRVFGDRPLPMHIHSFAWWVFAVLLAHRLFARFFARRVALLATTIFALAPCHSLTIAWLANREALVCLTAGAIAIDVHLKWHQHGGAKNFFAAALLFTVALLGGGEYALSLGGYVLAIELVRSRSATSGFRRFFGWVPFALPAGIYLGVRTALGYGTAGSGFYTDPIRDLVPFLTSTPWRFVNLVGEGWFSIDTDAWLLVQSKWAEVVLVVLFSLVMVSLGRGAFSRLDEPARTAAKGFFFGSIAALVPVLAVVPSPRLLGVAMLGIAPVASIVLVDVWFPSGGARRSGFHEIAAAAFGFAQLVHSPGSAFLSARHHRQDAENLRDRAASVTNRLGDVPSARVGIVRGMGGTLLGSFALDLRGRTPAEWHLLSLTGHVLVKRIDERTIELLVGSDRSLAPQGEGQLFGSPDLRLSVGDHISLPAMTVSILEVGPSGPRRARFTFTSNADDLTWLSDDTDECRTVELPRIGFGAPFNP